MKHKHSEWMLGLLYAEEMYNKDFRVKGYDPVDQWFSWQYKETEGVHTVYGECEWLDGVLDYYKQQAHNVNVLFKGWTVEELGIEFAQVVDDNFWEIVLK